MADGCERWLHTKKRGRGERKMFTLANDRKHTQLVLLFQDVLLKDA